MATLYHVSPVAGLATLRPGVAMGPDGEPYFEEHGEAVYLAPDLESAVYWMSRLWFEKRSAAAEWVLYRVVGVRGEAVDLDGQVVVRGEVDVEEVIRIPRSLDGEWMAAQWYHGYRGSFFDFARQRLPILGLIGRLYRARKWGGSLTYPVPVSPRTVVHSLVDPDRYVEQTPRSLEMRYLVPVEQEADWPLARRYLAY